MLQVGASSATTADQGISFGGDTVANLYRSAAGVIKTDGILNAVSGFQLNGVSINTAGTLSNVAYLNQSQTFTAYNAFKTTTNSINAFQIQTSAGATLFNADTSTTPNLITNGDIEGGGATGWSPKGAATGSRVTTQQWQGNGSLRVATTTAANDGASYAYTFGATTQYTLSLYAKVASGSITDVNIGRQDNGADIDCLTGQTLTTSWTRFSCTFTTGGTISGSNIYIKKTGASAETFYIDGVQLQTGASVTAFNAGGALQIAGVVNSPIAFQNLNDSATAFQIQNSAGTSNLFVADTTNSAIGIGITPTAGSGMLQLPNVTGAANGLALGSIQLYQPSLGVLKVANASRLDLGNTNSFITVSNNTASFGYGAGPSNELGIKLGSSFDTNLYRSGAAELTTNGNLVLQGGSLLTNQTTANLFNATATTLNIGGAASTLNIGPTGSAAGSIVLAGGSADTGCTVNDANGNLTCSGNITGAATGTVGYWTRSGTTLSPSNTNDNISVGSSTAAGSIIQGAAGTVLTITGGAGGVTDSAGLNFNTRAIFGYDGATSNAQVQGNSGKGIELITDGTNTSLALTSTGMATFKNESDSTTALQVKNVGGTSYLTVDTLNQAVTSGRLNVGTVTGNRVFSDNFETGTFGLWNTTVGSPTIDTTTVFAGKYSEKVTAASTAHYVERQITGSSTMYVRGYVYVASQSGVTNATLFTLYNSTDTLSSSEISLYRQSGGNLAIWSGPAGGPCLTDGALSTGAWHKVEMKVVISNTGSCQLTVDDGTPTTSGTVDTLSANNPNRFKIGTHNTTETYTAYFDEFAVDTVAIDNAGSATVQDTLHVGGSATFSAPTLVQPAINTATAFQVQNASGVKVLTVDTSNQEVAIGAATTGTDQLYVQSGIDVTIHGKNTGSANLLVLENSTSTVLTVANSGATTIGASTTALTLTGTPAASATSSLIQVGAAIAGGNAVANGGTYLGINLPASGSAGSAADFLNFQKNGVSVLKVGNSGNIELRRPDTTTENSIRLSTTAGNDWKIYQPNGTNNLAFWGDGLNQDILTLNATNGSALFKNKTNSTTAFQVQNAAGTSYLGVDTTNQQVNSGMLNVGTVTGNRVFSDNFETGTFGLWNTTVGSPTIDTTTVFAGKYSEKVTSASAAHYVEKNITGSSTMYARGYVYVASQGATNASLFTLYNSTDTLANSEITFYRTSGGSAAIWSGPASGNCLTGGALSTGAWHKIEMKVVISNTGSCQLTVDDGTPTTSGTVDTLSTNNPNRFKIGTHSTSETYTGYFDEFAVDTVAIDNTGSATVQDTLHVGGSATFSGTTLIQNAVDSTTAFTVQNAAGTKVLAVDTSNGTIGINATPATTTQLYIWAGTSNQGQIIDQASASTADLLRLQHNSANVLSVSSGGNITANGTSTATTGTTSGTGGTNVTTITLSAAGSFANNDVIFVDNTGGSGQDYYTRIVSGGGTTTLTVSPAVSYGTAAGFTGNAAITKYNVQYLGNNGSTFTGATRSANSYFQGYFTGGVVTGTGSTVYSDGNINSVNDLQITAPSTTFSSNVDAASFSSGGTTGLTLTCSSGQSVQGETISGGIIIGGSCVGASYARVYNSAAETINSGVVTTVTFNSERVDTDSYHSTSSNTSRLTAPSAGFYHISAAYAWFANSTGERYGEILLNGTTNIATDRRTATSNSESTVSADYFLNAGDYVEFLVYQTCGAPLNLINNGNNSPEFSIAKMQDGGGSSWAANGTSIYYTGGSVGIGTTTPSSTLDVESTGGATLTIGKSTATSGVQGTLKIMGARNSGTVFGQIDFYNYDSLGTATDFVGGRILARHGGTNNGQLEFYTASANTLSTNPALKIDSGGLVTFRNATNSATGFQIQNSTGTAALIVSTNNVTTGYNAANSILDVTKDSGTSRSINAAGTINASGADYAEYIPWSGTAPGVGSVVTYNGSAYVVSSPFTAGFVGNDNFGGNSVLVTFAGQVPVKVTGAVNVGDLLVDNGDGTAKAINPSTASITNYLAKLGIAQEASTDTGVKLIKAAIGTTSSNVAVGLQSSANFTDINVSGTASINNLTVTGSANLATLHVTSSAVFDADITVGGHVITAGGQPTVSVQAAAGTQAALAVSGTDTTGTLTITTGSNPTAGDLAKIIFSKTYGQAPHIVLSPSNNNAAGLRFFKGATTATDFMLDALDNPAPNTTYTFDYFIAQ